MKCKSIHNKIIFYLEGNLQKDEMMAIEKHLQICDDCKKFTGELQKTLAIIEKEKIIEVNPFFYTRLKSRMQSQSEKVVSSSPVFLRILQPVAFTVLLLIGVYSGIKIGESSQAGSSITSANAEIVPFLNELADEPIESFLMD
ncbi:MAG: zf-HC2 domain-containing protein [Prolixibacteraceae bacterium]|nr:zf-HC2 domain-containing protein [Prolixibacteraceae bacterium]MBN2773107.1 zf-HC2 domain-containing protein [Prolixibacteraceae bacterium]